MRTCRRVAVLLLMHCAQGMVLSRAKSLLEISRLLQDNWNTVRQTDPRHDEMSERVCAALSSKHGTGLFACQDLPSGTLATLYPVHALGVGANRLELEFDDGRRCPRSEDRPYAVEIWHKSLQDWAPQMWIDADPRRLIPGWLGHMANDAASCAGAAEEQILAYYEECARATNAVMVPYGHECAPLMCIVTTCDVAEGDELLLSYGHTYWITRGMGRPADGDELTPAVVAAGAAVTEPALAVQVAIETEYAPEIGRFEQLFAAAARDATSEAIDGRDVVDERREAAGSTGASAAAVAEPSVNSRRQRREAKRRRRKNNKPGPRGGGAGPGGAGTATGFGVR
jgi:hypothetical protein